MPEPLYGNRTRLTCLASHAISSCHGNFCVHIRSYQYQWMVKSSMSAHWRCPSCSFMTKARFVILLGELPASIPRMKALNCLKLLPSRSLGSSDPLLFTKVFNYILVIISFCIIVVIYRGILCNYFNLCNNCVLSK